MRATVASPLGSPLRTPLVGRLAGGAFLASATLALTALTAFTARAAHADEPTAPGEPRLMHETAEITSVVDAFDEGDPFDLDLTIGFRQAWKSANVRRETALNQPGLSNGGFVAASENVAAYRQSVSTLELGADIGLFHDLALIVRLPIVLSDARSLEDLDGSTRNPERLLDPAGAPLFGVPFKSPGRSGIDAMIVGLDWGLLNQQRSPATPTWIVGVDAHIPIGAPLHACNAAAAVPCPDPADPTKNRDPGISRGMYGFGARTLFSRRFGYVEPYTGFKLLAEFAKSNTDFGRTSDFQGSLLNHPPLLGSFLVGAEVVPWEQREQFQRIVAGFGLDVTYHSPGRDYSELFDALGSSQAPSLRTPNPSAYHNGVDATGKPASVADPAAPKVYFTGITDSQAFGSVDAHVQLTWQAGRYIKFVAGGGVTYAQPHVVTAADACNPAIKGDVGAAGPCHSGQNASGAATGEITGIPNPNHRDVIDLPGRRFSIDDTIVTRVWIDGVVMF